jgi:hypothetical protein
LHYCAVIFGFELKGTRIESKVHPFASILLYDVEHHLLTAKAWSRLRQNESGWRRVTTRLATTSDSSLSLQKAKKAISRKRRQEIVEKRRYFIEES